MHYHETDCGMKFDESRVVESAKNMIAASHNGSTFRGSPVIACIEALVRMVEEMDRGDIIDDQDCYGCKHDALGFVEHCYATGCFRLDATNSPGWEARDEE